MNELMLAAKLLDIARLTAPFRFGGLMNSIIIERIPSGFKLTSRGVVAPYNLATEGKWVHKRWKGKKNPNEGWWSVGVFGNCTRYIDGYYNNNFNSDTINYQTLAEKSKDFPAQNEVFLEGLRR